ncbi:hypothetical protein GE107_07985 [Cohnella sp. CFH 77786]|uniref:hypothetical protein n=1 Tax=Cohnella sp. CFH 77786 TaxID=2662265 RepID=UPI001C60949E|nr:hypothetical protein [Cohnella sp. CFH 77786]MBW5445998.1 hypothetical protein [Cohnella sp. CFH 77786]
MYGSLAIVEMGFSLILLLSAWLAVRQALRLPNSGTAERLHRKTRKLLSLTGWLTLPALVVFFCIGSMMMSLPSLFWEDRLLLNAPLIGAPLLAVWFTTAPMLLQLRKQSNRASGPIHPSVKAHLRSRLFVLPYQSTVLGAATSFYCTLISPVPYDPLRIAAPLSVYVIVMVALWMHHDRRFARVREWLRSSRAQGRADGSPLPIADQQAESRTRI